MLFHFFETLHADVILYPTLSVRNPPKIEDVHGPEWTIDHKGQKVSLFLLFTKNVDVASAANLPAITLPIIQNPEKDKLPIGVELASLTGYDRKLFAVSRALEKIILGTYKWVSEWFVYTSEQVIL